MLQQLGTGTRRLHDAQTRNVWLIVEVLEQKRERPADSLPPTPCPSCRTFTRIGGRDLLCDLLYSLIERRKQTRLTIGEQLIERAPRYPRLLTHSPHRRGLQTTIAHDFADREQQPPTLHLNDLTTLTRSPLHRSSGGPLRRSSVVCNAGTHIARPGILVARVHDRHL